MKILKNRWLLLLILQITILFPHVLSSYAWTPPASFQPVSRESIIRTAGEEVNFSWQPLNSSVNPMTNSTCDSQGRTFPFDNATEQHGEAYTMCRGNNVQNWDEFYSTVNSTTGGTTQFGNDCSGLASMSWTLPKKYTTTDFACDALDYQYNCDNYRPATDNYVTKLGWMGEGQNVKLQRGDAFVYSGSHIILFQEYHYTNGTKDGIVALEETEPQAQQTIWTWGKLNNYTPIRRNQIMDNYFDSAWYSSQPVGIALDSSGYLYVADQVNHLVRKYTNGGTSVTQWSYGTPGVGYSDISKGIAVGSGYVYVADDNNTRVKKFDANGSSAFCG